MFAPRWIDGWPPAHARPAARSPIPQSRFLRIWSMSAKSPRLATNRGRIPGRAGRSAPRHRYVDAADLALGGDLHHLLGAVGAQRQIGGKAVGLDEHLDLAATGGALQIAEDVAVGLAPIAGDALALAGHVAGEVELVAVGGAVQRLLETETGAGNLVVRLAADALGGAVGQRYRTRAGPRALKTCKRAGRLSLTCRNREEQHSADAGRLDCQFRSSKEFHLKISRFGTTSACHQGRLATSKV